MKAKQLDYLNIGLMILSFFLAVKLPFHVFLLSYAVLGPLHYLTEIGWLNERNYFVINKKDAWILTLLCLFLTYGFTYHHFSDYAITKNWAAAIDSSWFRPFSDFFKKYEHSFIFLAFYTAVMMTFVKKRNLRYGLMPIGLIIAFFLDGISAYHMIIGVMLPTIIHVYVFTGLFILYGALKNKSISGYASVLVFMAILFLIVFQRPKMSDYVLSDYWANAINQSTFINLSQAMAVFLGWSTNAKYIISTPNGATLSTIALKMQIFMAFAYTYHYLNWFSKTKIINWHKVSKKRLIISLIIWAASVGLYIYDYKVGLAALFFLSVLHVFLEFPLNYVSFVGIYKELKSRITGGK